MSDYDVPDPRTDGAPADDAGSTIIELPEAGDAPVPKRRTISEGEFVRHQVGGPLSVLKGWLELATRTDIVVPPELIERALTAMSAATDRLVTQMAALLDPATGLLDEDLRVLTEPCVVDDLIAEALVLSPHADRVVVVGATENARVQTDPERTPWILTELVLNAATHGTPNGPIELTVAISGDDVTFAVSSNGTLRQDEGEDVRAAFVHGYGKGLGLGLHRTTVLAEALGGSFSIAGVGRTTVQTLQLPKAP